MNVADREVIARFMSTLFPEVPAQGAILIWTPRGKRSYWASSIESAVDAAYQNKGDTYVGAGIGPRGLSDNERANADQVIGIPGLWADIDISGDAHKGKSYPPDEAAARSLIAELPIAPSLIVHSGHGLQPWWLLPELHLFEKAEERFEAAKISRGWNRLIIRKARAHGWQIDNVGDLSRIMRIAGTDNYKGKKVPCLLPDLGPTRARTLGDFDEYLTEEDYKDAGPGRVQGNWTYHHEAQPPAEKFAIALQNDKEFADTWNVKRPELHNNASRYDQALANRAALFKWSEQEIVNLMIAFRSKHGFRLDDKMRDSYFVPTIAKAEAYADEQAKRDADSDERNMLAQIGKSATNDDHKVKYRKDRLDRLEKDLGVRFDSILKTVEDKPVYILVVNGKQYPVGPITTLQKHDRFQAAVSDVTGKVIDEVKKSDWNPIFQLMLDVVEPLELDEASTNEGMVDDWIVGYLNVHKPIDVDIEDSVPDDRSPFIKRIDDTKTVCINISHLVANFLRAPGRADKITLSEARLALKRAGWTSKPVRVKSDEAGVMRRWTRPLVDVISAAWASGNRSSVIALSAYLQAEAPNHAN
ncbi:hypothetical protein LCGC14_0320240 [marine sediment metagenome]|uniref:RepB-like DNA primase domain-containing protein n=1 Tax=marine sediment metagenome TaxID=412755 RepID=A0A0F9W6W9_9ZZZZ